MGKFIDIAGQRFGELTAVEPAGTDRHGNAIWSCRCSCGTIIEAAGFSLRRGCPKSCGCKQHQRKNLVGMTFGNLTVIRFAGRPGGKRSLWDCKCTCGKMTVRSGITLCRGSALSCGCLKTNKQKAYYQLRRDQENAIRIGQIFNGRRVICHVGKQSSNRMQCYTVECLACKETATLGGDPKRWRKCRCQLLRTPEQEKARVIAFRLRAQFRSILIRKSL